MNKIVLGDFVEFNPQVSLKRGTEYPFVEMADLEPGNRFVKTSTKKSYSGGGARFHTNDVLFARITPCLENGKTSQFVQDIETDGFGSTEFFVLRGLQDVSVSDYVYYLTQLPSLRKEAEKSMYGASGRQRVNKNAFLGIKVLEMPLKEQHATVAILSRYDFLIQNNNKRIKILEEMAQAIYTEWFVNFRFPGHENVKFVDSELGKIPEGWCINNLSEMCSIISRGPSLNYNNGTIPVINQKCVRNSEIELEDVLLARPLSKNKEDLYLNKYDILINSMGVGTLGRVSRNLSIDTKMIIHNCITVLRPNKKNNPGFLYYTVNGLQNLFINISTGSTGQTSLKKSDVERVPVVAPKPELAINFWSKIRPAWDLIGSLKKTNITLKNTRDLLIPKLISGEIDVSKLDIDVEEEND